MEFDRFLKAEQQQVYINSMRPVLKKEGLFSDTTENFVFPCEPSPYGEVRIRFRAVKNNIDRVFLVCAGERHLMLKAQDAQQDENFDYYEVTLQLENEKISYYFEIQTGNLTCFYDRRGVVRERDEYFDLVIIPGFSTPGWAKGAVMYQIYTDRFCNGDPANDVLTNEYEYIGAKSAHVDDWYRYPAAMDVREFYGGDLQGVMDKLDYLMDLGVDVIYFNPLFVSPSNHKYDSQDYDNIDPHVGRIVHDEGELLQDWQRENRFASRYIDRVTNPDNLKASNELFARLVEEAHGRGMKVILDGVFNHCGSFNKWMDRERIYENVDSYAKGAYVEAASPYRGYFRFHDENRWPYNPTYDGWWGHDTLPKLNYEGSRELRQYILDVGRKWVSPPYNADGWRLDVAADLGYSPEFNHQFWRDFRRAVKEANPEALILAEHYGNPREWMQGDQWDTVMNYDAFMEPVTWFLTGMEKHSDDYRGDLYGNADSFWGAMVHHSSNFSGPAMAVAMNELSNHDHSRFLTRTNHKVGRTNTMGPEAADSGVNRAVMREAVIIQMTWMGAPTIYYGDEAGLCGFTDPDNRRTYPWGREDQEMIRFHKAVIRMHKENEEFLKGSIKALLSEYNMVAYGRFTRNQASAVILNNNDHETEVELRVWPLDIPRECQIERIFASGEEGFDEERVTYPVRAGKVKLTMPKTSAFVLQYRHEERSEPAGKSPEMVAEPAENGRERQRKNFLHFL